jgi:hypothetical protein
LVPGRQSIGSAGSWSPSAAAATGGDREQSERRRAGRPVPSAALDHLTDLARSKE